MSVDIFDANVWVLAFTQAHQAAVDLRNEVHNGNREVVVDAYIYQEVLNAFDRSHRPQAGKLKNAFSQFTHHCPYVDGPTQKAVSQMNCSAVSNRFEMQLIGTILDIQPKDAPIVVLAQRHHADDPTIHTHDSGFGQLSPQQHNLSWLSMNYIQ